ncbi:universal stress protein [Ferruginibacter sp. HRS2-29]|uniref:universal stress protein n=1 Tax=Ferruginibacter sp. HRS2-29 TaxID=2487334 RepID=UPI0020CBF55C|nr:universal stress protein [Ferruginibacter sp. HRS2-29]MCP9753154.1 universal stress protein [Ferruginibacter sp. HRS2-29]
MEKILLAMDATNPNKNALEFACYLARLTGSVVTGVFLEDQESEEHAVMKRAYGMSYVDWVVDEDNPQHLSKMATIENNIEWFKRGCISREVGFKVHRDRAMPLKEMIGESRFADLIVMDAETNFRHSYQGTPSDFTREVLHNAECPVVIAPEDFNAIEEIVFTYNGTASSVFAIKQFTYLFPQFQLKKVTVLQINETGTWNDVDKYNFGEWLSDHYTSFEFIARKDNSVNGLFKYVFPQKNSFLVMGAYGRTQLSQFFKDSHADRLIRTMSQPVFITHH